MENHHDPFMVVTLLLLSTLLYEAQGINRKLMTKTISSRTTYASATLIPSKTHDNDGNTKIKSTGGNLAINSPPKRSKYGTTTEVGAPPRFPDVIDLAGMDYSPARRKPPIHN
ncbi:hypothetical protein L6452_02944 [Arctium lappa]|uniref:Uncharacterized protein n=1 Tax=Arctium lappa TaxID=4217 RepID=A0ACB9FM34_ARCLA|nr:hypothetical protein L6452_02944 [Arctium lappa]